MTVRMNVGLPEQDPIQDYVHPDDYTPPTYEIAPGQVLMRMKNLIPTRAKLRIYKSFILSELTCCRTVIENLIAERSRDSKRGR